MARPKKVPHKKRPDGTYEAKVTIGYNIDGKPIRKAFYSSQSWEKAKEKGERYKIEYELAVKRQEVVPLNAVTFQQVADAVLAQRKKSLRINTYTTNWVGIFNKHLLPIFGKRDIAKITPQDIEKYFDEHSELAKNTLIKHQKCLNAVFNQAIKNKYIYSSPMFMFQINGGKKQKEKDVYTPEEAQLVLEYAKTHRFGLEIELLLKYGVSRSELLGIRREDIDFDKRTIHIQRGVTSGGYGIVIDDPKNPYRNRYIAIDSETTERLRSRPEQGFIFTAKGKDTPVRPDGWHTRRYCVFMKEMVAHYKEQGIDIPIRMPHELRHTRATIWVNEGRNLFAIAEQLGWSDLEMLRKVYGHGDIDKLRTELDL